MKPIRIITRSSQLALAQVNWVINKLSVYHPELIFDVIKIVTSGDKFLEAPLYHMGGKALFVKELDEALMRNEADLAIHSVKDIPYTIPDALALTTICDREDPADVLISPQGTAFQDLPAGAIIGTSSLRRMVQLRRLRQDLIYRPLRGNVPTRIQKCQRGEYDAIVLAKAGLLRLGMQSVITETFSHQTVLPAVGQGAIGIVIRKQDQRLQSILASIHHLPTAQCVLAERSMNQQLLGSCKVPIAGFAYIEQASLTLTARVGHPEQQLILEASASGEPDAYSKIGDMVAENLIGQGAKALIQELD